MINHWNNITDIEDDTTNIFPFPLLVGVDYLLKYWSICNFYKTTCLGNLFKCIKCVVDKPDEDNFKIQKHVWSGVLKIFLPRVETRGIIEAIDSEPLTETKSMLNCQRKSIWTSSTLIVARFDLRMTCRCTDKCNVLFWFFVSLLNYILQIKHIKDCVESIWQIPRW